MAGFFSKLFGGKKEDSNVASLVKDTTAELLKQAGFQISFDCKVEKTEENDEISIDLYGDDEELIKARKGEVLDAIQLFLKRTTQHHFPEDKTNIVVDCGGFREEMNGALIERAEHLKNIAIEQGKSVFYRALPPKERKVVHQYLAKDPRVKSRSLGDGLFKKIKIYPANKNASDSREQEQQEAASEQ